MSLTNTQYDELMREYSRKQLADKHLQQQRQREVYARIPQMSSLDEEVSSLSISSARQALFSDNADQNQEPLRQRLLEISAQRKALLRQAGYPPDYLEMHYTCRDCQDTGYIGNKRCHCFRNAAIDLFYTQSGLKIALEKENFSRFSFDCYPTDLVSNATGWSARENMFHMVSDIRNALNQFDTDPPNFLFYGETGLGKTFLSHCIAKELLDSAHSVLYYSAPSLFDELADIRFSRNADTMENSSYFYDSDLLIIDDLGTELTNSFTASALFLILNERLSRRRSTLISTNLMLRELSELYSERVFSRITSSFRLFEFFGNDIRLHRQLGR